MSPPHPPEATADIRDGMREAAPPIVIARLAATGATDGAWEAPRPTRARASAASLSVPSPRVERAARDRALWMLVDAARLAAVPVLLGLLALVAWGGWVWWRDVPEYLLPSPAGVWEALRDDPGRYAAAGRVTLLHALGGLVLGSGAAFLLAVGMAHSRTAERALYPFAILIKVTPIVAVAPLIVIWFGYGHWPKAVVAALITFFPMLVNAVTGLRSIDPAAHDFLRSMRASRWRVLRTLRLPSSVPYVFAALRISVPLSLIGAIVAEWTAADSGMGQVIVIAHGDFDTAALFAAIVVLALIGVMLTAALALVEWRLLFWHHSRSSR